MGSIEDGLTLCDRRRQFIRAQQQHYQDGEMEQQRGAAAAAPAAAASPAAAAAAAAEQCSFTAAGAVKVLINPTSSIYIDLSRRAAVSSLPRHFL